MRKAFNVLFLSLTLSMSFYSSLALAAANQSFHVDGTKNIINIDLQTDVYRTDYKYEDIQNTCYKQWVEYRQVCQNVPRQSCTPGPQVCHQVPKQQCQQAPAVCRDVCHTSPDGSKICRQVCSNGTPVCTTVTVNECRPGAQVCSTYLNYECTTNPIQHSDPYTCVETVKTAYDVFDHHTVVRAKFVIEKPMRNVQLSEFFTLSLDKDELNLKVKSSKIALITSNTNTKVTMNGNTKNIDAEFNLTFTDIRGLQEALTNITNISLDNNEIAYTIGAPTNLKLKHRIKLEQKKLFGKKALLDRSIKEHEMISRVDGGKQKFIIELANLDIIVKERTHFISIQVEPDLDKFTNVLNKEDILGMRILKQEKIKL
jgi:hypothetical protein